MSVLCFFTAEGHPCPDTPCFISRRDPPRDAGALALSSFTEDAAAHAPAPVFWRCVSCPLGDASQWNCWVPGELYVQRWENFQTVPRTGEHVPSRGVRAASRPQPQALVHLADDCSFAGVKPSRAVVSVRISLVTEDAECRSVSLWPFVSSLDNCPFKFFVPLKSLFRVWTLLKTADTAGVSVHKTGDVQGSLRSPRTRTCLAPDRPWNWVLEAFVRADQRESRTGSSRVSVLWASVCLSLPSGEEEESRRPEHVGILGGQIPTADGRGHGPAESRIRPLSPSTGNLLSLRVTALPSWGPVSAALEPNCRMTAGHRPHWDLTVYGAAGPVSLCRHWLRVTWFLRTGPGSEEQEGSGVLERGRSSYQKVRLSRILTFRNTLRTEN